MIVYRADSCAKNVTVNHASLRHRYRTSRKHHKTPLRTISLRCEVEIPAAVTAEYIVRFDYRACCVQAYENAS